MKQWPTCIDCIVDCHKFNEAKWVEWSKKQSKLVPKTLENVFLLDMLLIYIDKKNKTLLVRETDNTNSIIVQQEYVTEHTNQSNDALTSDYSFDRRLLHSYKGLHNPVDFIRRKYKLQMRKKGSKASCRTWKAKYKKLQVELVLLCNCQEWFSEDTF